MTRPSILGLTLAGWVSLTAPSISSAQTERDVHCLEEARMALVKDGMPEDLAKAELPDTVETPCDILAQALVSRVSTPAVLEVMNAMVATVPPRDLQSRATGNAGTAGAPSQGEAVPSVQPLALAGGSLAAVGSAGGTDAIAAFTINPTLLFGSRGPLRDAALRRLLDLTVLAPVNDLDRDDDGAIDYWGIRARVNVTGAGAGKALAKAARAFADNVQKSAVTAEELGKVLRETPTFAKCVAAFSPDSVKPEEVAANCGRELDLAPDAETLERFRDALAQARDSADAGYLGLDLRLDQGDPTLGATPAAAGTALFAGLAVGRKIFAREPAEPSFGLKARLGVQHVSLDDATLDESDRTNTAIDGALAFDFTYPYEFQPLKAAAGLEFRAGDPPVDDTEEEFRTNYLLARLSLDVPVTAANSITISFAGPLTGEERPTLSINGNWQLLLPGLSGGEQAGAR